MNRLSKAQGATPPLPAAIDVLGQLISQLAREVDDSSISGLLAGSNAFVAGDVAYLPEPNEVITLDFSSAVQFITNTPSPQVPHGVFTLTVGGTTVRTTGTIRVQGTGTASRPKKNWTLRFFRGAEALRLQIGKSVPSARWVFKADWFDPSMSRNYVSYALWRQMSAARDELPKLDVDHAWWGNAGADAGNLTGATGTSNVYPMVMTINGEFYGLGFPTLKDEPLNYNLRADNPDHIYFELSTFTPPSSGAYPAASSWRKLSAYGPNPPRLNLTATGSTGNSQNGTARTAHGSKPSRMRSMISATCCSHRSSISMIISRPISTGTI